MEPSLYISTSIYPSLSFSLSSHADLLSRCPLFATYSNLVSTADRCIIAYDALRTKVRNAQTKQEQMAAQTELEELRYNIEDRMEQLEDFYMKHDSENKAMLFEKQGLRLRRLLHSDVRSSPTARVTSTPVRSETKLSTPRSDRYTAPISSSSRGGTRLVVRTITGKKIPIDVFPGDSIENVKERVEAIDGLPKEQQEYELNDVKIDEDVNLSSLPDGSVLFLQRPSPKMAYSTNRSPRDQFSRRVHRRRTKEKKKVAPIYDWETSDNKPIPDHTQYKLEGEFEFQIKLTTKEFFKLTSRRRAIGAEKRHKERTAGSAVKESLYLQSDGPYVDPGRITSSIYRSPRKGDWMDSKGLRPYQKVSRE